MKIKNLRLLNFRNYESLEIDFSRRIIYIVGLNGQGKTNIAEAVSVLSLLSSFRTKDYKNLVNHENDNFFVSGKFETNRGNELSIKVSYDGKSKKVVFQDKVVKKYSEYFGKIPLVYLVSDEHVITTGSPQERRKFLDQLLSLVSVDYFETLQQYNKVIKQKNALLTEIKKNRSHDSGHVDVYNRQLANYGAKIISYRSKFVEKYETIFEKFIVQISENIKSAYINYKTDFSSENLKKELYEKMKSGIKSEISRGYSIFGPHRDDLDFGINDQNLKDFGSKGQHKIFLVALKLAQIEFIKSVTDEYPIFILDDLYAEIDNEKSERIAKILDRGIQTIITTCEEDKIKFFNRENIEIFRVEAGVCKREEQEIKI